MIHSLNRFSILGTTDNVNRLVNEKLIMKPPFSHVTYRSYSQDYPYNLTEKVITMAKTLLHLLHEEDKDELDLEYLASLLDTE